MIKKSSEGAKELGEFEIVVPAKSLLDSITISTKANDSKVKMNEGRLKEMKLVLGYLNAYIKAFGTKTSYFKLIGISSKIKAFKKTQRRK